MFPSKTNDCKNFHIWKQFYKSYSNQTYHSLLSSQYTHTPTPTYILILFIWLFKKKKNLYCLYSYVCQTVNMRVLCIINGSVKYKSCETVTGDGPCGPSIHVTDVMMVWRVGVHGPLEDVSISTDRRRLDLENRDLDGDLTHSTHWHVPSFSEHVICIGVYCINSQK